MPTFSVSYIEPGTYVNIRTISIPATAPGTINLAIIGNGKREKNVLNVEIVRGSGDTDELPYDEERIISISPQITDEYGDIYKSPDDYEKTEYENSITWKGNQPLEGTKYYVNMVVTKTEEENDFDPQYIESEDIAYDLYGNRMEVNSMDEYCTLPTAISLAMRNGSGPVIGVQVNEEDADPYETALNKLQSEDVQLIVIAKDIDASLLSALSTHLTNMSTLLEGKFRRGLVGIPKDTDNQENFSDILSSYSDFASVNNKRLGLIGVSNCEISTPSGNMEIGAWGLAAAIGGIVSNPNNDPGEPITGKLVTGFESIKDKFIRKQKNRIAGNGVTIVEKDGAVNIIRHFLSTDMSTPATQELKITGIADYFAILLIKTLNAVVVNTRNLGTETINNIKAIINLLSSAQVDNRILEEPARNVSVVRSEIDPRQMNVGLEILPVGDVNWIYIDMGVVF